MVGSGSDTVAQNLYNLNTKSRIVVWFLIHRSSIVTPEESQRLTSSPDILCPRPTDGDGRMILGLSARLRIILHPLFPL